MITLTDEVERLGQEIAEQMGRTAGELTGRDISWYEYGMACQVALNRGRPMPDPEKWAAPLVISPVYTPAPPAAEPKPISPSQSRGPALTGNDVIRARELRLITRGEARAMMGLPVSWWHHLLWWLP